MMRDARAGKFDIIYTKSVSRFARNTIELLEAVRELRDIGVEVVFEKENIRSSDPTSELMLTVAATIAEDDLKVDSERQRWSFKRRFENGWISIGNGMYGYRMLEDNTLEIVPEEAAVVRRIFEMYINGAGSSMIAATLDREGIPSRIGKGWRPQTILEMLANEKYMGDSLMGKSVTINGRQFDNMNGEYGQRYYMEDTHEGIISKETFALVQELRLQRKNRKLVGQPIPEYPFTGIIECGECGKHYQHKVNNSGKKWQNDIWCCATSLKKGVAVCSCTRIKDSVLRDKFIEAYNEFVTQRPQGDNIAALQSVVSGLKKEESELAALRMQRLITEAGFRAEQRRIKTKIYGEYLAGISIHRICRGLEADGIPTKLGKKRWAYSVVHSILCNEKYTGNAILGKTYKPDVLTKYRKKNNGQAPMYYVEGTHPAIIDKEMFDMVQSEMERRKETKEQAVGSGKYSSKYPFSGLLVCGECGHKLRRHVRRVGSGKTVPAWGCCNRISNGRDVCDSHHVNEETLQRTYLAAISEMVEDSEEIMTAVRESAGLVLQPENEETLNRIGQEIIEVQEAVLALHKTKQSCSVSATDYATRIQAYSQRMQELEAQQEEQKSVATRYAEVKAWLDAFKKHISDGSIMDADDSTILKQLVEQIIVGTSGIEIQFKCGVSIEKDYE